MYYLVTVNTEHESLKTAEILYLKDQASKIRKEQNKGIAFSVK